jgi:hypothetical protein
VVKDAVLTGECDDPILQGLLEITIASINDSRPLYATLLEEPAFYRKFFRKWVVEGLKERSEAREATTAK